MGMIQSIETASDRVFQTLLAGLQLEFGRDAGEALARRFLEAEEVDFLWDARILERWLGGYESLDEEDFALERVAILGRLGRRNWFVATMIVGSDGKVEGMIGKRTFRLLREAYVALAIA
jgi:hypothetical protein